MAFTLGIRSFQRINKSFIELVSKMQDGSQFTNITDSARSSADGQAVAFVVGSTTEIHQIYHKDLNTGRLTPVSSGMNGPGNGNSYDPHLSADGRYVVFTSFATNLTSDNTVQIAVFRKDVISGEILKVSTSAAGEPANDESTDATISADGRYVAFSSNANNLGSGDGIVKHIFIKDLEAGGIVQVMGLNKAAPNGSSLTPHISADGRYVVFLSAASNLVPGDTNGTTDVFRYDIVNKTTERVSTTATGGQSHGSNEAPVISADNRYVVFASDASDLVVNDTNESIDIFRKDMVTGDIIRVSTSSTGGQADDGSFGSAVSGDGRYVTFRSDASNLGDSSGDFTVAYMKDVLSGELIRLSVNRDGVPGTWGDGETSITQDGRFVFFSSGSPNLVQGDGNAANDLFRIDTSLMKNAAAIREGRYVETKLDVGSASSVSLAWGDGAIDWSNPVNGIASFSHAYATSGVKAATVTLRQDGQTWIVPHRVDLATTQMVRDVTLVDTLEGSAGNDLLKGDAYANIVKGAAGKDKIYGGLGKDVLTGGTGKDYFVFDTAVAKTKNANIDTITDFSVRDDTIWLENAIFRALGKKGSLKKPAKLDASMFWSGSSAHDADDRIIYNKKTGALYYDADGTGAKAAIKIAILKKNLALTDNDFYVI
ncbi:PD40 domain-containing protein [Microvirga flavescens]|uniref:PD40 domain-containing protein n=1 Tax=Microvirga flavescens TaxID=2249811 RepID=UPI000DD72A4F|nr:PD40 domain-containing protein [Microvirga flavescens]